MIEFSGFFALQSALFVLFLFVILPIILIEISES